MIIFNKIFIVIFSILCFQSLSSEENPKVCSFFTLEGLLHGNNDENILNGQTIEIRGFLYETADSNLILAAEPDLKSCCIGSTSKRHKQLLISGNIQPEMSRGSPITLQGNLYMDFKGTFPFKLQNAIPVAETTKSYSTFLIAISTLALISVAAFFKMKQDK
jgi:hypothetical protein